MHVTTEPQDFEGFLKCSWNLHMFTTSQKIWVLLSWIMWHHITVLPSQTVPNLSNFMDVDTGFTFQTECQLSIAGNRNNFQVWIHWMSPEFLLNKENSLASNSSHSFRNLQIQEGNRELSKYLPYLVWYHRDHIHSLLKE